jgi:hypothetical protein
MVLVRQVRTLRRVIPEGIFWQLLASKVTEGSEVHDTPDALVLGEVPIATDGIIYHLARCNAARRQSSEISTRVHLNVRVVPIARVEVVDAGVAAVKAYHKCGYVLSPRCSTPSLNCQKGSPKRFHIKPRFAGPPTRPHRARPK